jgi:hypothetical protein
MKVCKKRGCRKNARYPSNFCTVHGRQEVAVPKQVARKPPPKLPAMPMACYMRHFIFEDAEAMKSISDFVEEVMQTMDPDCFISGARHFEPFQESTLQPLLDLIVAQARSSIHFPIRSATRTAQTMLVLAPPLNSRSSSYTRCKIHRDFHTVDISGVYTFELFLDEVTADNGAIEIWPKSKTCPQNEKCPKRVIRALNLESETLVGPRGTVFVWDSRLLHQSLPNKIGTLRKTIVWMVNPESRAPIIED